MRLHNQADTRRELIRELNAEYYPRKESSAQGSATRRNICLKSCCKGNVLWQVRQATVTDDKSGAIIAQLKFLACYLLLQDTPEPTWGYRYYAEEDAPEFYTCPLSYLKMTPIMHEGWRDEVEEHHLALKRSKDYTRIG